MFHIPFLYINVSAFCGFLFIFIACMASKKTPAIRAFIVVLLDCILWSGSSILMRLQIWPGIDFWFYVSLAALFVLELLFYTFVHIFYKEKKRGTLLVCLVGTLAILPGTVTGYFLAPPTPVVQANGQTYFTYQITWQVVFPCILAAGIIALTVRMFLQLIRRHGLHAPGLLVIISGGVILFIGNLMQAAIPGNTFPYDMLAGIFFAVLLLVALCRRRMFRMTLLISQSFLLGFLTLVCVLLASYAVNPIWRYATGVLHLSEERAVVFASVTFLLSMTLVFLLMRKLVDAVFVKEELQGKKIRAFTTGVSKTLSTAEIMDYLSRAIREETSTASVYILLKQGDRYVSRYCSQPLKGKEFAIQEKSPFLTFLKEQESYLFLQEFRSNPLYLSTWEREKRLMEELGTDCIFSLKVDDDIGGLVLISAKERGHRFGGDEVFFLETVCSVASIAMKNANLYEQIYQEARIDPTTGVYNYRFFTEQATQQFEQHRGDCLAMLYVDIDDFKLYNQLYGVACGDDALRRVSACIVQCVGSHGTVYRTSGKVFSVLLPGFDVQHTYTLAEEIALRIRNINTAPERRNFKPITVSLGICVAPYAASSAKELIDNADFATYHAKKSGKNSIFVFREGTYAPRKVVELANGMIGRIIENDKTSGNTMAAVAALTAAIDAKDHYTYAHSQNVARYAVALAVYAGLNEEQVRTIYMAGLLHDVGKISIPESILNKEGKLTDDEYRQMKEHVNNSIGMIRHLPEMDYIIPAVLGHHERWDGKGYPRGIAGEEIPIAARCLAVADVFDAMTTNRPYRPKLSLEYALQQITAGAGTQLDPRLAELFCQLLSSGEVTV